MSRIINNSKSTGKIGMCVFSLVFVVIGLVIIIGGISDKLQSRASANWLQANGKIIASRVESKGFGRDTKWYAVVIYGYDVNGIKMKGNRITLPDFRFQDKSRAQGIADVYPVGKDVKVYYNPKDVKECLLEPGIHDQSNAMIWFGFAFFGVGSLLFIAVLKGKM